MLNILDTDNTKALREFDFFFILDTFSGLGKQNISAINCAMRNVLLNLNQAQKTINDYLLNISVMECGRGIRWQTIRPEPVSEFMWHDILPGGGHISWEKTICELSAQLSRRRMLDSGNRKGRPVVVFISDTPLEWHFVKDRSNLHENKWYRNSYRVAITSDIECVEGLRALIHAPFDCVVLEDINHLPLVLEDIIQTAVDLLPHNISVDSPLWEDDVLPGNFSDGLIWDVNEINWDIL